MSGKSLLIYIWNFHVLSNLLLIYICKLHWNRRRRTPHLKSPKHPMQEGRSLRSAICYRPRTQSTHQARWSAASTDLIPLLALPLTKKVHFHVLSNLLLIYICKLHWNFNTMFVCQVNSFWFTYVISMSWIIYYWFTCVNSTGISIRCLYVRWITYDLHM